MFRMRRSAVMIPLLLALAACDRGLPSLPFLTAPLPTPTPTPSGGTAVTPTAIAKVLKETPEVLVIKQALPAGKKSYLRLPASIFQITPGAKYQMRAQLLVADSAEVPTIKWSSSDERIATVEGGLITGKGLGSAVITAEVDGQKAELMVVVQNEIEFAGVGFGGSGSGGASGGELTPTTAEPALPGELVQGRMFGELVLLNTGTLMTMVGGFDGKKALNTMESAPFLAESSEFSQLAAFTLNTANLFRDPPFGHTITLAGMHMYVLGGTRSANIQRITLGGHNGAAESSGLSLRQARRHHAQVDTDDFVIVMGGEPPGSTPGRQLDSVEFASKTPSDDKSVTALSSFSLLDVRLNVPRKDFGAAIVGDYVYVFGGTNRDSEPVDTIERAPLELGGLGAFEIVERRLPLRRHGHTVEADDSYVYVIGGQVWTPDNTVVTTGEVLRARIGADGSLGAFEVWGELLQPRFRHASLLTSGMVYVAGGNAQRGVTRDVEAFGTATFAPPIATPTPSATPTPAAIATPAAGATATPTPAPTASPTPSPTPSPSPSPSPTATP